MKIWLDDIREMPIEFDVHVKTAKAAIELLSTKKVTVISLDHDLGDTFVRNTGYEVAKFIEEEVFYGRLSPFEIRIHSANPIGRANIQRCIDNCNKMWTLNPNIFTGSLSFVFTSILEGILDDAEHLDDAKQNIPYMVNRLIYAVNNQN